MPGATGSGSTPSSAACSSATTRSSSAPAPGSTPPAGSGSPRSTSGWRRSAPVQPERACRREVVDARPRRPGDLAGLPDWLAADAAQAAADRGLAGKHVITLSRSSIEPFLQYSARRDLREKAFAAWIRRGENGGTERQPRHHGRDGRAPRRARPSPRLRQLRGVPPRRHDGEDAGGGGRPAHLGVAGRAEPGRRRRPTTCRR